MSWQEWSPQDYQRAKSVSGGQFKNPKNRARLLTQIQSYEQSHPQEGLQAVQSALPAPQETDVQEIRGRAQPPVSGMPSGDGGSGGASSVSPSGEGGSSGVPEIQTAEQERTRLDLKTDAENKAGVNFKAPPPEWMPKRRPKPADMIGTDQGGNLVFYTEPGLDSFKAELQLAAEKLRPQAEGAQQAISQLGSKEPGALVDFQSVVQQYQEALRDAQESHLLRWDSKALKAWQDRKYAEFLAQHSQNPDAGPVLRVAEAPTNTWDQKIQWARGQLNQVLNTAMGTGASAATMGLAEGPVEKAFDPPGPSTFADVKAESPFSAALGATMGVIAPGGAPARIAKAVSNVAAPVGSGAARRVLGGALAGGATTAAEGAVADLSSDLMGPDDGTQRFGGQQDSELTKALLRGGIGGLFGGLGSFAQGKAQKALRSQDALSAARGEPVRGDLEAAGFKPTAFGGISVPEELEALGEEALKRKTTGADVLARGAGKPMADASAFERSESRRNFVQLKGSYGATPEGMTTRISAAPMIKALDRDIERMTHSTGDPLVGAKRKQVEELRWGLFDKQPVARLPMHLATARARNIDGGIALTRDQYMNSPLFNPNQKIPRGEALVFKPKAYRALQLEDHIDILNDTIKREKATPQEGQVIESFKAMDRAAREMRDKFPWPKQWLAQGKRPPTEVIEEADGTPITLKGWSALVRKAANARGEAEDTAKLAGIRDDLPFSRQKKAEHIEPFLAEVKNFPVASEAKRDAMMSLAADAEMRTGVPVRKYLGMLSAIRSTKAVEPQSSTPGIAATTSGGVRAFETLQPQRLSNAWRALLLKVGEEDPGAPSALKAVLVGMRAPVSGGRKFIASKLPDPRAFGLNPIRVGQGRLGLAGGAAAEQERQREDPMSLTPEDVENLELLLNSLEKK